MEREERRPEEERKRLEGAEAEKKVVEQQEPGKAPPPQKGRYTLHREGGAPVLEGPEPENPPKPEDRGDAS